MSEDGLFDLFDEPSMEIQINTLMGTSFDMRVSSTDTIHEIKQRIQRVEGIPIHQQTLIFQSKELKDSGRLCDVGIKNGSIVKLVVAMKGGPISTRRLSVSYEQTMMLKELKELLENTRDEIGDKLVPGSKVSVLVFKEGDILNLLRVIENEDGSYSLYSEKPIAPPTRPHRTEKYFEEHVMANKVLNLKKEIEEVNTKRRLRHAKQQDQSTSKNNYLSYEWINECDWPDKADLKIVERDDSHSESEEVALKDKHRKPTLYSETKGAYSFTKRKYTRIHKSKEPPPVCSPIARPKKVQVAQLVLPDSVDRPKSPTSELEEVVQDLWEVDEPSSTERLKHSATCKVGLLKRRQSLDCDPKQDFGGTNYLLPSAIPPQYLPSQSRQDSELYVEVTNRFLHNFSNLNLKSDWLSNRDESIDELYGYYNLGCTTELSGESKILDKKNIELPPVIKKRSRCSECNRKLNITNIYNCRCGKMFCSQHRYAEVHHCSYDYKTEGRRILEQQNPLVTAEKVHRI